MIKKLFRDKDILFSTLFVFVFIGLLKLSFVHLPHLDPIHAAFEDFDITDMVYQHKRDNPADVDLNSPVVVAEIGLTREEIARQIIALSKFQPKVVAVDAYFLNPKDPQVDSQLVAALSSIDNLVIGSFVEKGEGEDVLHHVRSFPALSQTGANAFINFVGEENKTIRYFSPVLEADAKTVNSFAAEIVKQYNGQAYEELLRREKQVEYIHYTKSPEQFLPVLSANELTDSNTALSFLKDKIVILGEVDKNSLDDLHFTPMNTRMAGRSKPDMPGVFIHANTVEMILKGSYVNKVPDWVMLAFSVLFTYLTIVFYTYYYVEKHIWYHLMAKIVQFVFFFLFVFIELFMLDNMHLRFSDKIVLVPIVLSVDLLYFYDAFVKWLHHRFGYHTYFMKGH
jgi:CHASE2 domain-containing sensor protein